jgi:hypothetical protein
MDDIIPSPNGNQPNPVGQEETDAALLLAIQDAEAVITTAGGNCPVQIEGTVDDHFFYFRARGQRWSCEFATKEGDLCTENVSFRVEQPYGDEPFAAGWMPLSEAYGFLIAAIGQFRQYNTVVAVSRRRRLKQ